MTGTVEFIQRIRYVEIPDEKGEMQVYAIPETVENVRELVRCKDCIYGDDFDCPAPLPTGYLCQKGHGSHTGDWFCADGGKQ